MTVTPRTTLVPSLAIMAALSCSSLGAVAAKALFSTLGAEGVTALRVGFSALLLTVVAQPWRARFDRRMLETVLGYGMALGFMNTLIFQAFQRIPIGLAVAIEVMGPLSIALLHSRRPLDFLWIAIAVSGLLLLLPLREGTGIDPVGILFALGAAACWAIYIALGARISPLGTGTAVSLGMIVAAFVTVPIGVVTAGDALLTREALLVGIVIAVLSSAVPYLLEMFAFNRLPQRNVGVLLSSAPAIAALVAAVALHETLTMMQSLSIALVMVASAGSALAGRNRDTPHDQDKVPE